MGSGVSDFHPKALDIGWLRNWECFGLQTPPKLWHLWLPNPVPNCESISFFVKDTDFSTREPCCRRSHQVMGPLSPSGPAIEWLPASYLQMRRHQCKCSCQHEVGNMINMVWVDDLTHRDRHVFFSTGKSGAQLWKLSICFFFKRTSIAIIVPTSKREQNPTKTAPTHPKKKWCHFNDYPTRLPVINHCGFRNIKLSQPWPKKLPVADNPTISPWYPIKTIKSPLNHNFAGEKYGGVHLWENPKWTVYNL